MAVHQITHPPHPVPTAANSDTATVEDLMGLTRMQLKGGLSLNKKETGRKSGACLPRYTQRYQPEYR